MRASDDQPFIHVQASKVDVTVTVAIEDGAVDGRIAVRGRADIDARLAVIIKLGVTMIGVHECLTRGTIRQQRAGHPVSAIAVDHHW